MTELGCDSIEKLKGRLPNLENELKDNAKFKDFYQFTFNYAKNPGQKGLDLDMAIAYWNIVLKGKFKFLDLWCKYLQVRCYCLLDYILLLGLLEWFCCFFRIIINDLYQKIHGICC